MDGRTNRRTDMPGYRDARTHLKSSLFPLSLIFSFFFCFFFFFFFLFFFSMLSNSTYSDAWMFQKTDPISHSLFLDASSHLYKRVCPSVGPSVGPSVRPSVRPWRFRQNQRKSIFLSKKVTEEVCKAHFMHPEISIRRSISPLVCQSIDLSVTPPSISMKIHVF